MAILSFISIITLIFYFFVKNALSVIRVSQADSRVRACQELNVLGFLQATGGKSWGAGQSEKSDGESFSRVSASCAGQRSQARTGGAESLAGDGHQLNLTLCKSSQYNSHYDKAYFYHLQSYIEEFESVTIFYGYILGFSELVADCSPTEVMVETRGPLISWI